MTKRNSRLLPAASGHSLFRQDVPHPDDTAALKQLNTLLEKADAATRVRWALEKLPAEHVMSSSFGAQAAVSLHLLTQLYPTIPVILIDTGYLFPETYQFIDEMTSRLQLNIKVFRSDLSPTWLESRYGRLWEQGVSGIKQYNQLVKVAPMQQALEGLDAATWFAGLRRTQSDSRQQLPILSRQNERWKFHPILDWSNRDVHYYLDEHALPYHPLWHEGYVSIGDVHTTRPLEAGMLEEETRFNGLFRECGLHDTP